MNAIEARVWGLANTDQMRSAVCQCRIAGLSWETILHIINSLKGV